MQWKWKPNSGFCKKKSEKVSFWNKCLYMQMKRWNFLFLSRNRSVILTVYDGVIFFISLCQRFVVRELALCTNSTNFHLNLNSVCIGVLQQLRADDTTLSACHWCESLFSANVLNTMLITRLCGDFVCATFFSEATCKSVVDFSSHSTFYFRAHHK